MPNVFAAVGDETRRDILDRLLVEGSLSLSVLSASLPMSRQAVTKHLNVLEHAGLIERYASGRERIHVLSAEPLRELTDWLTPYEAAWPS